MSEKSLCRPSAQEAETETGVGEVVGSTSSAGSSISIISSSSSISSTKMELRGVTFDLFVAVGNLALLVYDCKDYWSMERISAFIVGNHEICKGRNTATDLCRWYKDVETDDSLPPEIKDKLINILVTRMDTLTFKEQCSLIDLLRGEDNIRGHSKLKKTYTDVVGERATTFLSFAYLDNYFELIDSLEVYFLDHPEFCKNTTYFWFDLFVNDQWNAPSRGFEWWSSTFAKAIANIGRTVGFVSPWKDPTIFKKVWCLFEISCTPADNFFIILSKRQKENLHKSYLADFDLVFKNASNIDLEKAEARIDNDRTNIFEEVVRRGGFAMFNKRVIELVKEWISLSLESFLAESCLKRDSLPLAPPPTSSSSAAAALSSEALTPSSNASLSSGILSNSKNTSFSFSAFSSVNSLDESSEDSPDVPVFMSIESKIVESSSTLTIKANIQYLNGNLEGAYALYLRALLVNESSLGEEHPLVFVSMRNLAKLLVAMGGRNEEASLLLKKVLEGRLRLLGPEHPDTITSIEDMKSLL